MARHRERLIAAIAGMALAFAASATTAGGNVPAPKTANMSLVVVDRSCATVVEPYKISDNIGGVLKKVLGGFFTHLRDRITKKEATPDAKQIPDEARLEAKRMNWLPMNVEVLYGQRLHDKETLILDREKPDGKKYYAIADSILDGIKQKIPQPYDYEFKLFILKNGTRHALARPGGFLYLDLGLLKDPKRLDKAYFAIAHEISHVLKRHETRELQGLIVDSFQTTDDIRAIARAGSDPEAVLGKVKFEKDTYTRHHIDQELQADACAARLLGDYYADDAKLARTINAFLSELPPLTKADLAAEAPASAAGSPATPAKAASKPSDGKQDSEKALDATAFAYEIVSTPANRHPNSKERTENLRSMYSELTTKQPPKAGAAHPSPRIPREPLPTSLGKLADLGPHR